MKSAGMVLAAGGIAAANEAVFSTMAGGKPSFNWRIIPATLILALVLGGLEQVSEPFAKALAGMTLVSVIVLPYGHAPSPLDNAAKLVGTR
jgi:hypothetical protein